MQQELLLSKNFLQVEKLSDSTILVGKWIGFTPSQNFRQGVEWIFRYMKDNNIDKVLMDSTEQKVVQQVDREYAFGLFKTMKESLNQNVYQAMLQPKDIFNSTAVQDYIRFANGNLGYEAVQVFDNKQKAIDWLNTKSYQF